MITYMAVLTIIDIVFTLVLFAYFYQIARRNIVNDPMRTFILVAIKIVLAHIVASHWTSLWVGAAIIHVGISAIKSRRQSS